MSYEITPTDVWAGDVAERPTDLADILDGLTAAGVNLEFVIVRPAADLSARGILFIAPVHGDKQTEAARRLGLQEAGSLHVLRVAGPDRPGLIALVTRTLADAALPLSGMWAAALRQGSALYLWLESGAAARRAAQILGRALNG